jgi:uncharacterized protein (DUF488 family)
MKKLYTMGYTQKPAKKFFNLIDKYEIKRIIDIRLHNNTQLAGFTKQNNLKYFLKRLSDCDYCHIPLMAPSKDIFDDSKKNGLEWKEYASRFNKLINQRKIEQLINEDDIDGACLLCCEPEATNCHRSLVAEYLQKYFGDIQIIHI